jgi:Fe-S-cluster containining protein
MPEIIKIGFEVATPLGLRGMDIDVEDVPTRLAELVPVAQLITDTYLEAAISHERSEGRALSCRSGCGACCRQYVAISIPEAFYLVEMLSELPEDRRRRYRERMTTITERLQQEGLLERVLDPTTDRERLLAVPKDYFRLGLPCPFLTDESCSIYAHRPTPCRDHNITSPAELCRDPYGNTLVKVPSPLPLSGLLSQLTAVLCGGPRVLVPLSQVTHWVDDHRELDQRSWPGPTLVKDFLAQLGKRPG